MERVRAENDGNRSSSVNSIYGEPLMHVSTCTYLSKRPSSPEPFLISLSLLAGGGGGGVFERVNQFRKREIGLPQFYLPRSTREEADARQTLTDGRGDDKSRDGETLANGRMLYGVVLEYVFTEIPSKEENRGGIKRRSVLIRLKPAHDTRGYRDTKKSYLISNFVREGGTLWQSVEVLVLRAWWNIRRVSISLDRILDG